MALIPIQTSNNEKLIKYVAGRRYGYMKELKPFGDDAINSMKTVGFLKTGYTAEAETFSATRLLKKYFIVVFGETEYIKQRLKSVFRNKHKNI